jgi:hypothetical protein
MSLPHVNAGRNLRFFNSMWMTVGDLTAVLGCSGCPQNPSPKRKRASSSRAAGAGGTRIGQMVAAVIGLAAQRTASLAIDALRH